MLTTILVECSELHAGTPSPAILEPLPPDVLAAARVALLDPELDIVPQRVLHGSRRRTRPSAAARLGSLQPTLDASDRDAIIAPPATASFGALALVQGHLRRPSERVVLPEADYDVLQQLFESVRPGQWPAASATIG